MKGGKPGQRVRRRGALERLEKRYAEVKAVNTKDYPEHRKKDHEFNLRRMEKEMEILKSRIM